MLRPTTLMLAVTALFVAKSTSAADIDFASQIQPVFVENCAGCHGEKKGMGKLRLHTAASIQEKWDADDHLIVKGKPEESELYERLVLPADHKKFMPKKGKPLPKEQLDLIKTWIEQGAAFTVAATTTPETEPAEKHEADHAEHAAAEPKEIPLPEVDAADDAAIERLTAAGAQVTPLYAGSNLLQVSFALRGEPATDAELAALTDLASQVYSLNLAKAQISDLGLAVVSKLKNLSKLHLENSSVTDSGLAQLSELTNLQYLNLYGTQISDEGLKSLESLKNLSKLYVWQTKVSYDAAKAMEKSQAGLAVDLGFDHPVVMRKRLEKQLKQAEETAKETDEELNAAQAALDKAKQEQENAKKQLEELKTKLGSLDGKAEPEQKAEANPAEEKPAAEKPDAEAKPADSVADADNKA